MRALYNLTKLGLARHGWSLEDLNIIKIKGGFGYQIVVSRDTKFGRFPRPITDLDTMPNLIHKLKVNEYVLTVETDYHTSVEELTLAVIGLLN